MKKSLHISLAFLLVLTLTMAVRPFPSQASETKQELGDSGVFMEIDESGVLHLTGNGTVPDHVFYWTEPYKNYEFTSIVFEDGVTGVGESAFQGKSSVTYISLGSLQSVGMAAFMSSGITSLVIPSTVTVLHQQAFTFCNSLTTVYCLGTTPPAHVSHGGSAYAFYGSNNVQNVYVPAAYADAYRSAAAFTEVKDKIEGAYFVTFDANGGSGSMNLGAAVNTGNVYTLTLPENGFIPPTGKAFAGWSLNGTDLLTGTEVDLTEDSTIYAMWKDPELTIHYVDDFGEPLADDYGPVTYDYGSNYSIESPDIDGYVLADPDQEVVEGTISGSLEVDVIYQKLMKFTVSPYEGTYDGEPHGINVTVTDPASGAEVGYASDPDSNFVDEMLFTDVTDAEKVYFMIMANGYRPETGFSTVTIDPLVPEVTELPTAGAITEGQSLSSSALSGGKVSALGEEVEGTFSWKDDSIVPTLADSKATKYGVIFTPDNGNITPVECQITVQVNKAPKVNYLILTGGNAEWTKGGRDDLLFTSNAPFEKFANVLVDGKALGADTYKKEEGSTKITLKAEYLETLAIGSHSVEIVSVDGSASTNFVIKEAPTPDPDKPEPPTPDPEKPEPPTPDPEKPEPPTPDPSTSDPDTGDNSQTLMWLTLMIVSVVTLPAIERYRKRKFSE